MIKYVDNYENLSKEKLVLNYNFENCKIITIKDLLLLNDINIDESLLCLLGTGLKIQFINFNYRKIYLWGLIGAEVECDRMILEKLNIPYMKMDKHKTAELIS